MLSSLFPPINLIVAMRAGDVEIGMTTIRPNVAAIRTLHG